MRRVPKEQLESFDTQFFPDVLSTALWVIEYMSADDNEGEFAPIEIARYIVDVLGISTTRQAVHSSLTKATKAKLCHKGPRGFKIMRSGQEELLRQMCIDRVLLIEPGRPFSAGIEIGEVLSRMIGVISINDPYVDDKTLDILHKHFVDANPSIRIRILTAHITRQDSFQRNLKTINMEGLNVEVRKITEVVTHDRYFIDNEHFWLSGNSLNGIGKKESFVVMLGDGMRCPMLKIFNSRWKTAAVI